MYMQLFARTNALALRIRHSEDLASYPGHTCTPGFGLGMRLSEDSLLCIIQVSLLCIYRLLIYVWMNIIRILRRLFSVKIIPGTCTPFECQ